MLVPAAPQERGDRPLEDRVDRHGRDLAERLQGEPSEREGRVRDGHGMVLVGQSVIQQDVDVDGSRTRVLVEQTTAVSRERLGDSYGVLSASELAEVDSALAMLFGL